MRRLVYLASAQRDLSGILDHLSTQARDARVGLRFVSTLRQQCTKLAHLPGTLGRPRPELRPDIRSFPHKGYVIFFRYAGETFEVVNVIDGRRDLDALFAEEEPPR